MTPDQHIIDIADAPTLAMLFRERVKRIPEATAYTQFRNDQWISHSWRETRDEVARWQAAMRRDGLQPGERVAVMCSNSWEWVLLDQAAQGLGLITVPVYTNDRAENIRFPITH